MQANAGTEGVERTLHETLKGHPWAAECPFAIGLDDQKRIIIRARRDSGESFLRDTVWLAEVFMAGKVTATAIARAVLAAQLRVSEKTLDRRLSEARRHMSPRRITSQQKARHLTR